MEKNKSNGNSLALISFALVILITIFKSEFSDLLFTLGLNYTSSHFAPYVILLILAFIASFTILKTQKTSIRIFATLSIVAVLFTVLILQHPIFNADFVKNGKVLTETTKVDAYSNFSGVAMLAMPGCGHCEEAMPGFGKFQTENPDYDARFFLMSKREENLAFYLKEFPELKNGSIPSDSDQRYLWKQTIGVFPVYIEFENGLPVEVWNANEFGVRVKDYLLSK